MGLVTLVTICPIGFELRPMLVLADGDSELF